MGKPPVRERTDAVTLLLTNQNVDLQRQVTDLRREIEEKRKEIDILRKALERPSIGAMTEGQIHLLAELVFSAIMGFPITKDREAKEPSVS